MASYHVKEVEFDCGSGSHRLVRHLLPLLGQSCPGCLSPIVVGSPTLKHHEFDEVGPVVLERSSYLWLGQSCPGLSRPLDRGVAHVKRRRIRRRHVVLAGLESARPIVIWDEGKPSELARSWLSWVVHVKNVCPQRRACLAVVCGSKVVARQRTF